MNVSMPGNGTGNGIRTFFPCNKKRNKSLLRCEITVFYPKHKNFSNYFYLYVSISA